MTLKGRAMLERDVARQIDEWLARVGLRVFRVDQGGGRFTKRTTGVGLPDRFGVLPSGRMFAIEIKRPGARPRANEAKQLEVLAYLRANNAVVVVASSVDDVMRCEALCPQGIAPRYKGPRPRHDRPDEIAK